MTAALIDALPSTTTFLVATASLAVAYIVFGITGFGTALIAAPVLAQVMPVATIVPLLALLDCAAAATTGLRFGNKVARHELKLLVPLMAVGSVIGACLLLIIPPRPMMLILGVFVIGYAIYGFLMPATAGHIRQPWVALFGTIGGVFSAMFGSGGFVYAIYLSRRLDDKDAIRATQSTLIGWSTLTRVVIFATASIYSGWSVPLLAICLVPAMLIGLFAGHRITLRLSREQFLRVLYLLLIASGSALILRAAIST